MKWGFLDQFGGKSSECSFDRRASTCAPQGELTLMYSAETSQLLANRAFPFPITLS